MYGLRGMRLVNIQYTPSGTWVQTGELKGYSSVSLMPVWLIAIIYDQSEKDKIKNDF